MGAKRMAVEIHFEWDARKAAANKRKHGISFELAVQVFDDVFVEREVEGDEHGEVRWQAIGQIGRALVHVTYTTRDEEGIEVIRIISARRATKRERRAFEGST